MGQLDGLKFLRGHVLDSQVVGGGRVLRLTLSCFEFLGSLLLAVGWLSSTIISRLVFLEQSSGRYLHRSAIHQEDRMGKDVFLNFLAR